MSPYRVLVLSKGGVKHVMCAQLSVDKQTGQRRIFIQEKFGVGSSGRFMISEKELAHMQTGKRNSYTHAYYELVLTDDGKRYRLIDRNFDHPECNAYIGDVMYTQSEVLAAAMNHHCLYNSLEVIQIL